MKKLLLLPILFLLSIGAYAQVPVIQWQKCLGGSLLEEGRTIVQTADSGFIVAGLTESNDGDVTFNNGGYDTWLAKLTPAGSITWQRSYGGSLSDNCNYIQQTSDGGYIFASSSKSNDGDATLNYGTFDFWVVKVNATGGIIWQKSYGGSGVDAPHCVKQTADGGYIVCGRTNSFSDDVVGNHGIDDFWVVRLSDTGRLLWAKCYGGTGDDDAGVVMEMPDGSFIVGGATASNDGDVSGNHGGDDYWVIRISDTGALIWQKCFGGTGKDVISDHSGGSGGMEFTSDSCIIVSGFSNSNDGDITGNHGDNDYWIVKMSLTGSLIWQKSYGGTGDDAATSIDRTDDGGYVIGGTTYSNNGDVTGNNGGYDYWVVKISDTGALQWQKCMGGTGASPGDVANGVLQVRGGGYIVAGFSNANDSDVSGNHGQFDYWVVKLNCAMPVVGPVSGPASVCVGSSIMLSDTSAGGVWGSITGKTTVSGGTVTGITSGTEVIAYTVSNTCGGSIATHAVTVNPLPVPVITATGAVLSTTMSYVTYQWLSGTTPIAGATNATYTATTSGTYRVIVTDANGCSDTSAVHSIVPAGLNSIQTANEITVLPNPTTGTITVTGVDNPAIKVYNTTGQLVNETHSGNISIADYPSGLYFVKVFNAQGVLLKLEKVVKH
jgi:hypothetical protein